MAQASANSEWSRAVAVRDGEPAILESQHRGRIPATGVGSRLIDKAPRFAVIARTVGVDEGAMPDSRQDAVFRQTHRRRHDREIVTLRLGPHEGDETPALAAVARADRDHAAFLPIRLRGGEKHGEVVFAVDQIIGARGDPLLAEVRNAVGAIPPLTAVSRVVEARRADVNVGHARSESEIGVAEVDAAGTIDGFLAAFFGRHAGDLDLGRRPQAVGLFDCPRLAAVQASSQHMLGGTSVIDGVTLGLIFEVSSLESDQDFIAPGPDAMIRRPAAESSGFLEYNDILEGARRLRGAGACPRYAE